MTAIDWLKQGIELKNLVDLGKFCFTSGTATLAFLVAAEKINAPSDWGVLLIIACAVLAIATMLAAGMVIAGTPHDTSAIPRVTGTGSFFATWIVLAWFGLWVFGTALGLYAVVPNPAPPATSG